MKAVTMTFFHRVMSQKFRVQIRGKENTQLKLYSQLRADQLRACSLPFSSVSFVFSLISVSRRLKYAKLFVSVICVLIF